MAMTSLYFMKSDCSQGLTSKERVVNFFSVRLHSETVTCSRNIWEQVSTGGEPLDDLEIREHTNWKKIFLNADFGQRLLWRCNFLWMQRYHFIQNQLPLRWVRSGCGVAAISRVTKVRLSTASQRSSSSYGGWLHGGMAGWKLEPTMIIGFRFRTGAKFVFFRETVKKLPPEYRSLLGSSSNTAMLKAGNTCNKHNFYLNNFIGT